MQSFCRAVLVYAVADDILSPDFPLGDALEVYVRREDPEWLIEEVRGDEPGFGSVDAVRACCARFSCPGLRRAAEPRLLMFACCHVREHSRQPSAPLSHPCRLEQWGAGL